MNEDGFRDHAGSGFFMRSSARLVALAATALALACLPATARAVTGNELWTYCAVTDPGSQGFNHLYFGDCEGFMLAIADALTSPNGIYGFRACFPANSTRGQSMAVVRRYLEQHPEQRHYQAGSLVAAALAEAFPCKP